MNKKLYARANLLALFTIFYNIVEGLVSVWFGVADETLSLFGFGLDSFIEVISAVGIWHLIKRIDGNGGESTDEFEKRALNITGWAFYALTLILIVMAINNLFTGQKPETTMPGVIISSISILFMWYLIYQKKLLGYALNSQAMLADAACAQACVYLSLVLLASSLAYTLTGVGFIDALGALGISWFTFKEGKESLGKAKGLSNCCSCSCGK
jgi:hypothetical protein